MGYQAKLLKNGEYSSYLNGKYHEFQGYEKCLEELGYTMQKVLDYAEKVEEENKRLNDEHWKDDRLQEMKEQYDRMMSEYVRGFPITKEEEKRISEWKEQHVNKRHNGNHMRGGAIGGSWEYLFVPTSIGTSGVCRCDSCYRKMLRELGREEDYKTHSAYDDRKTYLSAKYDCEFEFQEIG